MRQILLLPALLGLGTHSSLRNETLILITILNNSQVPFLPVHLAGREQHHSVMDLAPRELARQRRVTVAMESVAGAEVKSTANVLIIPAALLSGLEPRPFVLLDRAPADGTRREGVIGGTGVTAFRERRSSVIAMAAAEQLVNRSPQVFLALVFS